MYSRCALTTVFLAVLSLALADTYSFWSKSKPVLALCIHQRNNYLKRADSHDNEVTNTSAKLADAVANKFHNSGLIEEEELYEKVGQLIHDLSSTNKTQQVFWEQLEESLVNALEVCSDKDSGHYPPMFKGEPQLIAELLNYILVGWLNTEPLHELVQKEEGRDLMDEFVCDSQNLLMEALSFYESNEIKFLTRLLFMRRSQQVYDHRRPKYPFLPYEFFVDGLRVPTNIPEVQKMLMKQRRSEQMKDCENWEILNPTLKTDDQRIKTLFDLHPADRTGQTGEYDQYSNYFKFGITEAEFLFEKLWDQFFQALMFKQEIQAKGIKKGQRIPEKTLDILKNETAYREHKYMLRKIYADENGTPLRQSLAKTARPDEIALMELLITESPIKQLKNPTTTQSPNDVPNEEDSDFNECCGRYSKRPKIAGRLQENIQTWAYGPTGFDYPTDKCLKNKYRIPIFMNVPAEIKEHRPFIADRMVANLGELLMEETIFSTKVLGNFLVNVISTRISSNEFFMHKFM